MSFFDSLSTGNFSNKNKSTKTKNRPQLKTDNVQHIRIFSPKSFNDTQYLINLLKSGIGIIVDFSDTNEPDAQRIFDYLCGATFAINGTIRRFNSSFFISPSGFKICKD
ncbi:MAG: cell division protein SepF [Christensenellaceae bacterium]|jgi:cell division inhibitor SepF|nr:cell division protein SepF [Christensenellaceae bacterium]